MKTYLEKAIEEKMNEDSLDFHIDNIREFSPKTEIKELFNYQEDAIKKIIKVLSIYYKDFDNKKTSELKERLFNLCKDEGMEKHAFDIHKTIKNKQNKRFGLLSNYYNVIGEDQNQYISGKELFNRSCFWMATASGKSIVLIKLIEALDKLEKNSSVPKKDKLLLLPKDNLINQFKEMVDIYNKSHSKQIRLINLKNYDEEKRNHTLFNEIKVFYYRSDLLYDKQKDVQIDYKSYESNGNWYVFLDEAHRGEKGSSNMQDYVAIMSRNGFLFNFSATFTDELDYATTCKNFNLQKFIDAGYGKKIYLNNSSFNFKDKKNDFSSKEKIKQILKSFVVLTLIKKSRKDSLYHNPLLMTLVNSVNTKDSDLLLFFKKIEEIANGNFEDALLNESKDELLDDFINFKEYFLGDGEIYFDYDALRNITIKDIFVNIFNSNDHGKIEILEGEKSKEIALKMETSDQPFALIKIGDTNKFKKDNLGQGYRLVEGFYDKKYFKNISDPNSSLNLLIGSRSFYEGWDSNRPNVLNLINIGSKDAEKFVLQSIGRGIRIQPDLSKGNRQRLKDGDKNKNKLLETLFIFATDKKAVSAIFKTLKSQKTKEFNNISLSKNINLPFKLFIPKYSKSKNRANISKFSINKKQYELLKKYFHCYDKKLFLIKYSVSEEDYDYLHTAFNNDDIIQFNKDILYSNLQGLLKSVITHVRTYSNEVNLIKELEDEILHYKFISVVEKEIGDISEFRSKLEMVKEYKPVDKKELARLFTEDEINEDEFNSRMSLKRECLFKDLIIKNISNHYYLPLIYSRNDKINYIKHIIKEKSEVKFLENLELNLDNFKNINWVFSKIDETLDKDVFIPYFDTQSNSYKKFFPDFIFWVKKDNRYKVIFVDPKGTTQSSYEQKIDGYEKLFKDGDVVKKFSHDGLEVEFYLKMVTDDINKVNGEKYKDYWINNSNFKFLEL